MFVLVVLGCFLSRGYQTLTSDLLIMLISTPNSVTLDPVILKLFIINYYSPPKWWNFELWTTDPRTKGWPGQTSNTKLKNPIPNSSQVTDISLWWWQYIKSFEEWARPFKYWLHIYYNHSHYCSRVWRSCHSFQIVERKKKKKSLDNAKANTNNEDSS